MFNLYNKAIDVNGFMGLVSNKVNTTSEAHRIDSRKVVSGFAIASLAVTAVLVRGAEVFSQTTLVI
jgi:hypothetical protein